jgi:hypothetical protein
MKLGFTGRALMKANRLRAKHSLLRPKPSQTDNHCACGRVISGNKTQCGSCAKCRA